ncbi:PHP domain-containing protein [Pelagibius sp. 7325]|uniref:PHP domain-containing protein n=1 Tax=Pelagibius sp. 7325 TaxID=3131994 RepID=UPI0030EE463A
MIVVAATYPFDFQEEFPDLGALETFLSSCCQGANSYSIAASLLAFALFGLVGLAAPLGPPRFFVRSGLVALAGGALILAIELAQVHLPSRSDRLADVLWNAAGLIAGLVLGRLLLGRGLGKSARGTAAPEIVIDTASGAVTIIVHIRRHQAVFLGQLAAEMGVDAAEACRQIVALALNRPEMAPDGRAGGAAATLQDRRAAGEAIATVEGRPWQTLPLTLDKDQFQALQAMTETEGQTYSRTVRRLVAAFMERFASVEAPARPMRNPGQSRPDTSQAYAAALRGTAARRTAGTPARQKAAIVFAVLGIVSVAGAALLLSAPPAADEPIVVAAAPWAGQSVDIVFDHHTHTDFSDGALNVAELVRLARDSGCDALAITDHSDSVGTASYVELDAFKVTRQQNAGFLLIGGVEVNMPSYGRREHATVIADPSLEGEILPGIRDAAEITIEQARAAADKTTLDEPLLTLAASHLQRGDDLLMIYNHPSREDRGAEENYTDILRWNTKAPLFIGFAGAPGHQNAKVIGSYRKPQQTIDRWDPVVAEVGGTWDRLLSEGHQLWGALAGSDYHNATLDMRPCGFARTHLNAAAFSYEAVFQALRAGTFWADHGQILSEFSFFVEVAGLATPVFPGSIVSLRGEGRLIAAHVILERGPGAAAMPLQIEIIGNCQSGEAEILATLQLAADSNEAVATLHPTSPGTDDVSCYLRARVRLDKPEAPDLMAYSNPIRLLLR